MVDRAHPESQRGFAVMLPIGLVGVALQPGWEGLAVLAATRPELLRLDTVGIQTIVAWFGTFIINVPLVQAAFQTALSCRTAAEGRRALPRQPHGDPVHPRRRAARPGCSARGPRRPPRLVAVPRCLNSVLPAPLARLFFFGI